MELTVLGMNGPFPASNGATSGYLVRGEKTRVVMDMGSGTLGRLTALMPPEKLDALLLSHWHFDHCSDVLPLLFRLQACAAKPLDVYAPVDESSMVRKMVRQSGAFCLHDVQKDDEVQLGEFSVRVFAARHPVPGVMYRVTDGEKTLCYTGDTNTVEGLTDFAQGADLLIVDTAGRLHNKKNLMDELNKMRRVIDREFPEADVRCMLVLDATTGQNGLAQARAFKEVCEIGGIILTKLDGTAKGGIALAIRQELEVPVWYIGVGEGIDDLQPFNAKDFVEALF